MDSGTVFGAVYGAAVADALGSSFEGLMPDENRVPQMQGGGQFSLSPGEVTDDTLMLLALLETYLETGSFSCEVFLRRMTLTLRERPKTFGNTTRTLAKLVEMGCYPQSAAHVVDQLFGSRTNGSVMRTLPVGLVAGSAVEAETLARQVSAFTHVDREAADACAAVSVAVYSLLHGASKEEVLAEVPDKYLEGELYPSVDALEATRCAFCVFRAGKSYVDVVTRACRLGGDTDTIGAIAGGMAGALYGIEAIPAKWITSLDVNERIADGLRSLASL